ACILNTWFPNSHADVFISRLLDGYRLNGAWHPPRVRTVNFYVDQFSRQRHGDAPPARAGHPTRDRAGLDGDRPPQLVPSGPAVTLERSARRSLAAQDSAMDRRARSREALGLGAPSR